MLINTNYSDYINGWSLHDDAKLSKVISEQTLASQKCGPTMQQTQSQAATFLHLRLFQRGLATGSIQALSHASASHLATKQFLQELVVMALPQVIYCENQDSSKLSPVAKRTSPWMWW